MLKHWYFVQALEIKGTKTVVQSPETGWQQRKSLNKMASSTPSKTTWSIKWRNPEHSNGSQKNPKSLESDRLLKDETTWNTSFLQYKLFPLNSGCCVPHFWEERVDSHLWPCNPSQKVHVELQSPLQLLLLFALPLLPLLRMLLPPLLLPPLLLPLLLRSTNIYHICCDCYC